MVMKSLDSLVPQDRLLRKIDKTLSFDFIYNLVEDLYSHYGKPSIDPVVLIKICMIQYLFGIRSMRKTIEEISSLFYKNKRERMFCYSYNTACDKNGFILDNHVSAGNVHDSQNFEHIFKAVKATFSGIHALSADAGYVTPYIAKLIFDNKIRPVFPYKRPMTKKGFFKKHEFVYDEYLDIYICLNGKDLTYSTTNREGYKEYKSCPSVCSKFEHLNSCTESKNTQKVVTRHVWSEYLEEANHLRHTPYNKATYSLRS